MYATQLSTSADTYHVHASSDDQVSDVLAWFRSEVVELADIATIGGEMREITAILARPLCSSVWELTLQTSAVYPSARQLEAKN